MTTQTKAPTTTTASEDASKGELQESGRSADGKFLPGVSGNPNGRPKGKKNIITTLKQDLEIAIRENLTAEDVQNVVNAMLAEALNGNVGAGKLILDKVLSNARETEDEKETGGGLKVVIENATFEALNQSGPTVIDVKPEEISDEQSKQSEP